MAHLYSVIGTDNNLENTLIEETFSKEKAEEIFQEATKNFWAVRIIMDESIILNSHFNSVFPK